MTQLDKSSGGGMFSTCISTLLRGAGQVMFQDSPWTGIFFLLGILWGAWEAHTPQMFGCALLGLFIGTLAARLLGAPEDEIRSGLHGYNGILVGCALPVFFGEGGILWMLVAAGAFFSTVVMMGVSRFLKTWKVSAMTGPFVFVTWIILLASYEFASIRIIGLPHPVLPVRPETVPHVTEALTGLEAFFRASFAGVSQVFLIDSTVTGILFLIGLALSSLPAALFAWCGSAVAIGTAALLGADGTSIMSGLYQFSAVLTAIGLGSTFYSPNWRTVLYAFLGTVFTVMMQGALDTALAPLGIPTLTFPFVFAAWLFLLPNIHLMPESRRSPSA